MHFSDDTADNMVIKNANINNIMKGMESTGGVRLHNHRRKLKQRFDIIRKLGQGTYGKVQLGINKETGQEVAIKTIKKAKIETEADLIRIRREIQIMSSVQHPNIIHIYEVFENREKMVLVMEYAAGGELYDYLNERKVLPEDEARRIFRQIATAVYYCHKHKICHRDLKLENILLDEQGNAKIADFGLSNVFDEQRLLNTFCGSPLYASPEIVKGTPYYGPEVDCWSLGVLLYTLVYGAMPFDGSNFKRLVKQISQGDYFEPKKTSPASSLIREMLTVTPAKRADIEKVCSHWWVNEGYSESCLEIAEELAGLTPVRLDLLLSLAPSPSGVSTENIMQQGLNILPTIPHSDVPVRCHSMGSLMDIGQSPNVQQKFLRKQSLFRNGEPEATTSKGTTGTSAKRKLDDASSLSEINLKGHMQDDQGEKRHQGMSSKDEMLPEGMQLADEVMLNEQKHLKPDLGDQVMDIQHSNDTSLGAAINFQEQGQSKASPKDSDICSGDKSSNEECVPSGQLLSGAVESENRSLGVQPVSDGQVAKDLDDTNKDVSTIENSQKSSKIKHDTDNIVSKDGSEKGTKADKDTSLQDNSVVSKDPLKTLERKKDKQKKAASSDAFADTAKTSRTPRMTDSSQNKSDVKMTEDSVSSKSGAVLEDDVSAQKSITIGLKEKPDVLQKAEDLNTSSVETTLTPANIKDRKPKSAQSAENLNNISLNAETKTGTREKPKRLFIPGVKVSDFKKAFERKLSSPEISAVSFGKKPFTKSSHNLSEKSDDSINVGKTSEIQKNVGPNESKQVVDNTTNKTINIQAAPIDINNDALKEPVNAGVAQKASVVSKSNSSIDVEVVQDNTKAGEGNVDKMSGDILADRIRKENISNTDKVKQIKVTRDTNKTKPTASSKIRGSLLDGKPIQNTVQQPGSPKELQSNVLNSSKGDEINVTNETGSAEYSSQIPESVSEDSKVTATAQSKPIDSTGNKKRSKVEITLKSATLPRRKTSKAEIKLDPAIPPIEYKTEIEHMVSPPPPVSLPEKRPIDDKSAVGKVQSFRSWSLEPEGTPHQQVSATECIIPIQIENRMNETRNLTSPTSARPPMYPFQQRSLSQTQRPRTLSHQNTQESDSGETEKIKKSPREYIIPIAVEGGGYVTPRATSLEPSSRDDFRSSASSRSNHYRRMSSLLSDTSEDEGLNMPPMGLQRLSSLNRDRDEGRNFHFHRLRSSRPMRNSLERNDSLSSAEEDDDDDEGFEILTAESLFSTLLSRVRSLTQRLTVEDAKISGLPQNHFVNQLSNISNPSRPWRKFYEFHREPLSRRLSETSFSRLSSFDGDRGLQNDSGLSRDSSIGTDVNTGSSCSVRTLPRGSSNHNCDQYDVVRRGTTRLFNPPTPTYDAKKAGMRQEEYGINTQCTCSEPSPRKSSARKSVLQTGSDSFQNNNVYTPRKLFRTHSLRSTVEDNGLIDSPPGKAYQRKYLKNTAFRNNNSEEFSVPDSFHTASGYQKNGTQKHANTFSSNFFPDNLPLSSSRATRSSLTGSCSTLFSRDVSPKIQKDLNYAKGHPYQQSRQISLPRVAGVQKSSTQKADDIKFLPNSSRSIIKKISGGSNEKFGAIERSMSQQATNVSQFYNKPNDTKVTSLKLKENKSASALCNPEQISLSKPGSVKENNNKGSQTKLFQNDHHGQLEHETTSGTVKKTTHNTKNKTNMSAVPDTAETSCAPSHERRKSRFLRPDFFDTPPEESSYVKEREDKKAAEAELKQARRLSRRASLKESFARKTNTHDDKTIIGNAFQTNKNSNRNIPPQNSETSIHSTDSDLNSSSTRILNKKHSYSQRSLTSDNVEKKAYDTLPRKRESFGTRNQIFAPPISRLEKNIPFTRESDSSSLDMKTIATESTYLKRAVSVDDVSLLDKGSLSKNNAKGAGKINSVLRLFSKSENQNKSSHDFSPKSFSSTNNLNRCSNNSGTQHELRKEVDASFLKKANNNTPGKIKQSHSAHIISSENVNKSADFIYNDSSKLNTFSTEHRNTSKSMRRRIPELSSQVQPGAGKAKGKDVSPKDSGNKLIASSEQISHSQTPGKLEDSGTSSRVNENSQMLSDPSKECVERSNILHSNLEADTNSKQVESLLTNHNNQTLESVSTLENSDSYMKLDDSGNISPSCSTICATDNQSLTDENEKDSESVEDRIRRKSFYTRFNDVKKKVRKKSPQFLKENRANPVPGNHHRTQENQQSPSQINTGDENDKSADLLHYAESQIHGSEYSDNTNGNNQNEPLLSNAKEGSVTKSNEEEKANIVHSTSNDSTKSLTLLRPAAFVRSVLDKSSPKVRSPSQNEIQDTSTSVDHSKKETKH